jgi:high-affinity iron transporter
MSNNYFSVSVFFVLFRESVEVSIIVSVLLSFLDRIPGMEGAPLKRMVWLGTGLASVLCLIIGGIFIYMWYAFARNLFEENEALIEGVLMLVASVFLTITGLAFARGNSLYAKIQEKLTKKIQDHQITAVSIADSDNGETLDEESFLVSKKAKTVFFLIPFVSVLRDGLESVLLFAGVGISEPLSSIPLAAIAGLLLGVFLGFFLHRMSGKVSLRWFFVISAYILLLMAAGFLSKGVHELEEFAYVKSLPATAEAEEMAIPFHRSNLVWYFPYWSPNEYAFPFFNL